MNGGATLEKVVETIFRRMKYEVFRGIGPKKPSTPLNVSRDFMDKDKHSLFSCNLECKVDFSAKTRFQVINNRQ